MRGDINIGGAGSGVEGVNGLIEKYEVYAGENVSAGDFVEFVNNSTLIPSSYNYVYEAILIDNNKVLIVFLYNNSIYNVVCTISESIIIPGKMNLLINASTSNAYTTGFSVAYFNDKIVIIYPASVGDGSDANTSMHGIVCTVNEDVITPGVDTLLKSGINVSTEIIIIKSTGNIFITYDDWYEGTSTSQTHYLHSLICTISGSTITPFNDVILVQNSGHPAYYKSTAYIDDNTIFISHSDTSSYYLNGIVCTISGTTITPGTDTRINSTSYSVVNSSSILIDIDKIFISHQYSNSEPYVNGIVCKINGTTITPGTDTRITNKTISTTNRFVRNIQISTNKVFIPFRSANSIGEERIINGIICLVNETEITPGIDTILVDDEYQLIRQIPVLINENMIFLGYVYVATRLLYGLLFDISGVTIKLVTLIRPITSSTQTINAVANTSGKSGQTVEVYVPEVS